MCYDLIGVGVGPSNLGLAALLEKVSEVNALFLEKQNTFSWHKDSTLPNAMLQTAYLKDLVTMVDPTSKFSFLNYLATNRQLYAFVNRRVSNIYRKEFDLYFQWVARSLGTIRFSSEVKAIRFDGETFSVETDEDMFRAKNIVLGSGIAPNLLPGATQGETVFHSSSYATREKSKFARRRIIVIGSGQSSAEIIDDLCLGDDLPAAITWITDRQNLFPLQDCSFSNEAYTPNYNRYFYGLPGNVRRQKNAVYTYTSDGITEDLSNSIYNKIYYLKFVRKLDCRFSILPHQRVTSLVSNGTAHRLFIKNLDTDASSEVIGDVVIMATGYRDRNLHLLKHIFPTVHSSNDLVVRDDYSVDWLHPDRRIFIQNGCKEYFGLADSNLSLSSWRNAVIINSLAGRDFYNINANSIMYSEGAECENHL